MMQNNTDRLESLEDMNPSHEKRPNQTPRAAPWDQTGDSEEVRIDGG